MYPDFKQHLISIIDDIREAGLYKSERVIEGPQAPRIDLGSRAGLYSRK